MAQATATRKSTKRTANTQAKRSGVFGRPSKRHGNFAMVMPPPSKVLKQVKDGAEPRHLGDEWERDAYVYADVIPEVGFVMNSQANLGAECRLVPQEFDADKREWVNTEDVRVLRVHAAFVGPQGGSAELLRKGFLHLGIAGEALLLGTPADEVDLSYGLHWEFLSPLELTTQRGGKTVRKIDGGAGEDVGDNAYVARIYRSHPMYSGLSDSSMRRCLGVCRDILNADQMTASTVESRLSNAIFYVPDEITFADDETPDEPSNEISDETDAIDNVDPFLKRLGDHMRAPIEDRTSPSALVPLLMRGPAEYFDKMGLIEVSRNLDQVGQQLRENALKRLAAGLDVDPAIIQGFSTLNHWTAYQIDAGFVTKQVKPTGNLLARALTEVYLRMMLEIFEAMTPEECRRYRWVFDTAPVQARTDEGASARVLYEMRVLNEDSLLKANGFDSSDKMEPEELNFRIAMDLLLRDPVAMLPVVADVLGLKGWNLDALPQPSAGGFGGGPMGGPAGTNGFPSTFTPPPPRPGLQGPAGQTNGQLYPDAQSGMQEPPQPNPQPAMSALIDRLAVAGDYSIARALEKAAARFATKARRTEGVRDRVDKAKGVAVLSAVGPADLALADCPTSELLAGAWDTLSIDTRRWVRQYLLNQGVNSMQADEVAAFASTVLCNTMNSIVEDSIHDTLPMQPNGTRVAHHTIAQALQAAGVG